MPYIDDDEFGRITVRKSAQSRSMKATVAPNGMLRLSVPSYAPIFMVKRMVHSSRTELRKLLHAKPKLIITDGMSIGKSHTLIAKQGAELSVSRHALQIIITMPTGSSLNDDRAMQLLRPQIISALRREAKAHLPHRIEHLAHRHGFDFSSLRFTHASSRWGSCNSKKAISLNIALMNLPYELIDYVLIHELAHTKQLNHSEKFWAEVARVDPEYRQHRNELKRHDPGV